jgi:hypothetical protein
MAFQDPLTMTAMRRVLVTLLVVLALAGCGGSESDDSGSDEPSASEPATPSTSDPATPTPSQSSPTITVSTKTTCDQLFSGNGRGPLEVVVAWWSTDEGMTPKLSNALEEVEQIAATAGSDLQPFLLAMVSETRGAATSGGDSTTFKAAGYEVTNVCLPLL